METQRFCQFLLKTPCSSDKEGGAREAFFVCWSAQPEAQANKQLASLLRAEVVQVPSTGKIVTSRLGLLSAWSAKVHDILVACSLDTVKRIERGTYHAHGMPDCDPLLEQVLEPDQFFDWKTTQVGQGKGTGTMAQKILRALSDEEQQRVLSCLAGLGREPTEPERALAAQSVSEHCRHITFNTRWENLDQPASLMESIRATHEASPSGTLVAYSDNSAAIENGTRRTFLPDDNSHWRDDAASSATIHTVIKAETHNHPTGVAPWPGAATGVGGEIRDEAATGIGAASAAGCAGYMVADLCLNDDPAQFPPHLASPWQVLQKAPLGATAYANEFGRPTLVGFCRTHDRKHEKKRRGFCKPVMFVAGMGEILASSLQGQAPAAGDLVTVLGGPAMLVGMGGGSSSSSSASEALDGFSVQRANAEMQRRTQEVIDRCRLGATNPLRGLHDIGAGGLGTALAELAAPDGCEIDLGAVPTAQSGMSATEILINEAQERYLAIVAKDDIATLTAMCQAENCPIAVIGKLTDTARLVVRDSGTACVDLPLPDLLGDGKRWPARKACLPTASPVTPVNPAGINLADACHAVLSHPNVADKSFLVTIADRGVGGLTARDQMVGPWQVAVSDCAVTRLGHDLIQGRALACGERPAIAVHDPAAGSRVAIAESLTNLAAAIATPLSEVKLALNWMGNRENDVDCGELVAAVRGACDSFLLDLGLGVPVGKDSLAMRARWHDETGNLSEASAPTTCVATAFGHCPDVREVLTPQLSGRAGTLLMRLNTSTTQPLGASVLAHACNLEGNDCADVDSESLLAFWRTIADLRAAGLVLAYHDISDGGMFATICEMCFAANRGATLVLDALCQPAMGLDVDGYEQSADTVASGGKALIARELFSEQPGAIIEASKDDAAKVLEIAARHGLPGGAQTVGWPAKQRTLRVLRNAEELISASVSQLRSSWTDLSTKLRSQRDDLATVKEEATRDFNADPGLYATPHVPAIVSDGGKPKAVVLRDQGTNGHAEMVAALYAAGFSVRTVTFAEIACGLQGLDGALLALPGGFAHGDTLGAGRGSAAALLHNPVLREQLLAFLRRDTLVLGVCNGCQVLAQLGELLPASCILPEFLPNRSGRFECRLCQVEILSCGSPFLAPLAGARLPVQLSCGEGQVRLPVTQDNLLPSAQPALRFVNPDGLASSSYPHNPTGAQQGLCGFASPDGQVTLLLPHPERAVTPAQLSWCPPTWQGKSTPWHDCFVHARNHLA